MWDKKNFNIYTLQPVRFYSVPMRKHHIVDVTNINIWLCPVKETHWLHFHNMIWHYLLLRSMKFDCDRSRDQCHFFERRTRFSGIVREDIAFMRRFVCESNRQWNNVKYSDTPSLTGMMLRSLLTELSLTYRGDPVISRRETFRRAWIGQTLEGLAGPQNLYSIISDWSYYWLID